MMRKAVKHVKLYKPQHTEHCGGTCGGAVLKHLDLVVWGSSLARLVIFLDKELHSTFPLFTQVYKWVRATFWGIV